MKRIVILAALGLAGVSCQGNSPRDQSGKAAADADQRYLQQLADRDQDMIAIATVAESKASEEHFRTMAHNCIAKQQADARQVEDWHSAWYGTAYTPHTTAEGRQMLDHLSTRSGKDFDREYLTDMIHEYQANVDASHPAAESSSRPELRQFAQQIVKEQSHQVSHLQEHLSEVNGGGAGHEGHPDDHSHPHDEH